MPDQAATSPEADRSEDRARTASAARVAGLVLALGASLAPGQSYWAAAVVMLVFSATAAVDYWFPRWARGTIIVESAAIAAAATVPVLTGTTLDVYLLIPPLAAGIRLGVRGAVVASASQAAAVVAVWVVTLQPTAVVLALLGLALVLGLFGAVFGQIVSAKASELYAEAAFEERRRLSREIHDGVAQDMAVLGFQIDRLLLAEPEVVDRGSVDQLGRDVRRILQDVRWSVHDLRGGRLPEVGLGTALADHVRRAAASSGMTAHLSLTEETRRLPTPVSMELLRIAQEAVTNARKHSGARNLWVELDVSPPRALLRVTDDGQSPPAAPPVSSWSSGFGMSIMAERARTIGADFRVRERPGGGTVVEAVLSEKSGSTARARGVVPATRGSVRLAGRTASLLGMTTADMRGLSNASDAGR